MDCHRRSAVEGCLRFCSYCAPLLRQPAKTHTTNATTNLQICVIVPTNIGLLRIRVFSKQLLALSKIRYLKTFFMCAPLAWLVRCLSRKTPEATSIANPPEGARLFNICRPTLINSFKRNDFYKTLRQARACLPLIHPNKSPFRMESSVWLTAPISDGSSLPPATPSNNLPIFPPACSSETTPLLVFPRPAASSW